ncbi:MAG: DUF192 domain-containing protein [Kofleriaceae bacterium]
MRAALWCPIPLLLAMACSRASTRSTPVDEPPAPLRPSAPTTVPAVPTAPITFTTAAGPLVIHAEVVKSPGRVQKGLMYRKYMPPDAGMLFLMGDVDDHHFWMHNTLIPLDIMFIDGDKRVVGILDNVQPLDETSRGVGAPSLYVLEVNGGWAKQHGISAGAQLAFGDVDAVAQ